MWESSNARRERFLELGGVVPAGEGPALLDAIVDYLPSPLDVPPVVGKSRTVSSPFERRGPNANATRCQ